MEKIEITTEYIKLDQLLKFIGIVGSGSDDKMLIADGLVTFNGDVCTMCGKKVRPGDVVTVEDAGEYHIISNSDRVQ
ncbi:RNA-binding S4 domain-containing protein [Eubacterium aggregans]|uniref:RNA-binding S4 domain-containing protein n=1 Tax=Eubacterium aggregans TaxID=81409 RepID=UPI003F38C7A4